MTEFAEREAPDIQAVLMNGDVIYTQYRTIDGVAYWWDGVVWVPLNDGDANA